MAYVIALAPGALDLNTIDGRYRIVMPQGRSHSHKNGATFIIYGLVVCLFALLAVIGPWVSPCDPYSIDLRHQYEPPSLKHLFGTADNGVDLLSSMLHGARLAGLVSACVVLISMSIGTAFGIIAGYMGGLADHVIVALADLVQAFPAVVLNIAILALVNRPGIAHLIFALSVNSWVIYTRLVRAHTLTIRESDFVTAARALGASSPRIFHKHIVPNIAASVAVQATGGLGAAVLAESTLSFLGLGPAKTVSWGSLLDQGTAVLLRFPHVALISGSAIALIVLSFNRLGDALRDRLDPRV